MLISVGPSTVLEMVLTALVPTLQLGLCALLVSLAIKILFKIA